MRSLTASFSGQADNLSGNQLYTTRGLVYNANASTRFGSLGLAAGYNGYRQLQSDGTAHVNDTTKVDRVMHSLYFSPSYMVVGNDLTHTFSLSGSYTRNEDLNPFATGESDVTTYAIGASYNVGVQSWDMDFTTSLSHQRTDGYQRQYTSDILSLTTGRNFLKEKNLSTQLTLSMCYNEVKHQMKSLSLGADMSVGYTLNEVHVFSLTAVAPHSLNVRPIVVAEDSEIKLTIESRTHNFLVALDGRSEKLDDTTKLTLRNAPYRVKVIKRAGTRYFHTLREKMMWGVDQRG